MTEKVKISQSLKFLNKYSTRMALATTPVIPTIRPACKRRVEKPIVVMEDTRPSTCSYNKHCLAILMNIFEKRTSMPYQTYDDKITKIAEMITCEDESDKIFQTFCGLSFLDRYQEKDIIVCAMQDLDKKICKVSWRMTGKLQDKCAQLLTRMGTIENLSSQDADLILILCGICKSRDLISPLFELLLQIGRSVWPYIKRQLWHTEAFVDFVADIFESIGDQLEQLYPKNFSVAWKVICKNLATRTEMSCYSRWRLLAVFEHRHTKWSLPRDVKKLYQTQYNEMTDTRKKEILVFLGLLSSKRKTSLTVKPGRSAADFLKRRQSYESQEIDEHSSSLSGDGSELLSEVLEDEGNDNVFSPNSSTDSLRNELLSNTDAEPENGEFIHRQPALETRNTCVDPTQTITDNKHSVPPKLPQLEQNVLANETKTIVDNKHDVPQDSSQTEQAEHTNEHEECVDRQNENLDGMKGEIKDEKETKSAEMEEEIIWEETGSIWRECENPWEGNGSISSPRNNESLTNDENKDLPEHRSFLLDRKKEIIRVPEKYVGRVIGSQGSVITSIQDDSGATVRIVRPSKEKVAAPRPSFSMNTVKNMVHNSLGLPLSRTSPTDDDLILKEESTENEEQTVVTDEPKEFEFEIIGTDENIERAKWKIQTIISHAKSLENHAKLRRSYSDGDQANFSNGFRRSFYQERKKVIMKVGKQYVGRVIGSSGSMIMNIEEESGAKVTFVKDKKREKYKAREQDRNMEYIKETDGETPKDIECDEGTELNKDTEEIIGQEVEKVQNGVDSEECGAEKQCIEGETDSLRVNIDDSEAHSGSSEESSVEGVNRKVEEDTVEEYEFEIFGTDETIEKAKKKIEFIMKLVDNHEKKPYPRSSSFSAPRRGFKTFQRSLSCPIENWGDSCSGECQSCRKGCYCRSFLLEKSQSPVCWIRPVALALTQDADWAEFIVKTKVDDPTLWRPRKSTDTNITTGSTEDIANDCTSPIDVTADHSTSVVAGTTAVLLEPTENAPSASTSGHVDNSITQDDTKQLNEVFTDFN